jgi:hypothetical protein
VNTVACKTSYEAAGVDRPAQAQILERTKWQTKPSAVATAVFTTTTPLSADYNRLCLWAVKRTRTALLCRYGTARL